MGPLLVVEVATDRKARENTGREEETVLQILHMVGKRQLEMGIERKAKIRVAVVVPVVVAAAAL
ncbi:hypothetical protein HanXRQr2_Chr17g0782021 [Helianthus annuus]|uniref:Uncharacterized protein n=1 Tax=Helianthus annuus TaxID=4232 RepID=A0A9K3GTB1_HELAN|nr:hypothetical protein HanXRQr2_Chr17g0782021 [Helianthus annuus]